MVFDPHLEEGCVHIDHGVVGGTTHATKQERSWYISFSFLFFFPLPLSQILHCSDTYCFTGGSKDSDHVHGRLPRRAALASYVTQATISRRWRIGRFVEKGFRCWNASQQARRHFWGFQRQDKKAQIWDGIGPAVPDGTGGCNLQVTYLMCVRQGVKERTGVYQDLRISRSPSLLPLIALISFSLHVMSRYMMFTHPQRMTCRTISLPPSFPFPFSPPQITGYLPP